MEKLKRFKPIFSGKSSKRLWKNINKAPQKACAALYNLACHCQRLARIVEQLDERIAELEKQDYWS